MGGGLEGPDGSDVARCGTWAGRSTLDICEMGMLDHDHFGGLLAALKQTMCIRHFFCGVDSWGLQACSPWGCPLCKAGLCLQAANDLLRKVSWHTNRGN